MSFFLSFGPSGMRAAQPTEYLAKKGLTMKFPPNSEFKTNHYTYSYKVKLKSNTEVPRLVLNLTRHPNPPNPTLTPSPSSLTICMLHANAGLSWPVLLQYSVQTADSLKVSLILIVGVP